MWHNEGNDTRCCRHADHHGLSGRTARRRTVAYCRLYARRRDRRRNLCLRRIPCLQHRHVGCTATVLNRAFRAGRWAGVCGTPAYAQAIRCLRSIAGRRNHATMACGQARSYGCERRAATRLPPKLGSYPTIVLPGRCCCSVLGSCSLAPWFFYVRGSLRLGGRSIFFLAVPRWRSPLLQ